MTALGWQMSGGASRWWIEWYRGGVRSSLPLNRPLTIGRNPGCDVLLTDPSVSRQHAVLSIVGGRPVLDASMSRNGFILNQTPVRQAFLSSGQSVYIGGTPVRVIEVPVAAPMPVAAPAPVVAPVPAPVFEPAPVVALEPAPESASVEKKPEPMKAYDGLAGAFIPLVIGVLISLGAILNPTGLDPIWAYGIIWVVTSLCLLFCVGLVAADPMSAGAKAASACFIIPLLLVPAFGGSYNVWANSPASLSDGDRQVAMDAAPACLNGSPIQSAKDYAGDSHPLAVVNQESNGELGAWTTRAVRSGWQPSDISSVQLVACIGGNAEHTVQTCHYSMGGTWTRYQSSRDVWIVEARTGRVLDRQTYDGNEPGSCPSSKVVGSNGTTSGEGVNWDDGRVWDYIATWVSGPAQASLSGDDAPAQ